MTSRHTFTLAVLAAVSCLNVAALAQTYPSRPITMIMSGAAGTMGDLVARIIAQRMRAPLGQPIIIENIGGAEGSLGAGRTARAKPDGYTIDIGFIANHVLNGAVYSLSYDLMNDFAPVAPLTTNPLFLFTRKTMPAQDLIELIAWLKSNPRVSVGSTAVGPRLVTAFFQKEIGTSFTVVPYRGNAAVYQDLAAGHIDLSFSGPDGLPLACNALRGYRSYANGRDGSFASKTTVRIVRPLSGVPQRLTIHQYAWCWNALPRPTVRSRQRNTQLLLIQHVPF
jgi:tripartite-type tricarboxylate transporter receptor subunit TctC